MEYCWKDHLPQMPIPSDQNIWASFPAWCQRQNMWGLQTGLSVFKSIPKPGDIAILFGSAGHIQKTSCFMVNFSSLDKTKSKKWKDLRRGTAVVLCAFPYYLRRWKLNKWQIMALASPQSLGGIWCQGEPPDLESQHLFSDGQQVTAIPT